MLVSVCLAAACSSGSHHAGGNAGGGSSSAGNSSVDPSAARRYGYGPSKDARLQPDVVVVQGGAAAIRSVSDDGLTWRIDRSADGAAKLRTGSVLLATSVAAGRIVAVRNDGADRVVTLAPVEINDVLRDGRIHLDRPLDLSSMSFQPVPAFEGLSQPTPEDTGGLRPAALHLTKLPHVQLAAATTGLNPTLPAPSKSFLEVPVGDWLVKGYTEKHKLGVNIRRRVGAGGLKLGVDLAFPIGNLRIDTNLGINDGKITDSKFLIKGIEGMYITLQVGAADPSLDNTEASIELPFDINLPIPPSPATAGLPLNVTITYKLVVEIALTGKNATLLGAGRYRLAGPIGFSGGAAQSPSFSVEKSIIDSLGGITLGPSGLVFALKVKVLAGIGTPAATAGPFGTFTAAFGVTNGSSLGASLARCRGASLDLKVGGGFGLSVSPGALSFLEKFLPAGTKIDNKIETSKTVLHRAQVVPDVPLCRGP